MIYAVIFVSICLIVLFYEMIVGNLGEAAKRAAWKAVACTILLVCVGIGAFVLGATLLWITLGVLAVALVLAIGWLIGRFTAKI